MNDLSICIIQSPLFWENIENNLNQFTQKIDGIKGNPSLIVLPEMFSTGFSMNSVLLAEETGGKTMQWMAEMAKKKNAIITGSLIIKQGKDFFNRLVWMRPDGNFELYDKRHLFRMANENNFYSPGKKKLFVELNGWKLCPLICYDLRFPVWSRNTSKMNKTQPDYDVLLYVANWPEKRILAWQALLRARAIENYCYVVGVNRVGYDGNNIAYSGESAVINYKGELMTQLKSFEEKEETISISYSDLEKYRKSFPVGLDADDFEIKITPQ